jgi:hypothetical protein
VGEAVGVGVERSGIKNSSPKVPPASSATMTATAASEAVPNDVYFIADLFCVKKTLLSLAKRLKKPDIRIDMLDEFFFINGYYNKA